MSRDEVIENIGTIAHSGTRAFLEQLEKDKAKDAQLIGQFGVGFYSAFLVADRVTLTTRRAGMETAHGVRWESRGDGKYTIETVERADRGTEIVLHVRDEDKEFLDSWRLRAIVRKYSDHITFPVEMRKESAEQGAEPEYEQVNDSNALWTRPKSKISEEELSLIHI